MLVDLRIFSKFQGATSHKKFPANMHNTIWCPIYIPSFMKIGLVVSSELRWQDFGTDGRSDCTPRPAFVFGDAANKKHGTCKKKNEKSGNLLITFSLRTIKVCRFEIIDGVQYVYSITHAYKFLLREQVRFAAVLWRFRQCVSCNYLICEKLTSGY